jgi:hypothetical protein
LKQQRLISIIECFEKFFKEKLHIPNGNLIELRYEDLIENPYREIEKFTIA